ncbi:type II secretory pathway, component PulD [Idiomarina sp. A28L]|nr:type II secretory pathway, component PulD [Idiomarina sp. A28L]
MRILILLLSLPVLFGCSNLASYETTRSAAEGRLQAAYALPSENKTPSRIVRDQGYFVPPLQLPEKSGPGWFNLNLEFAFDQYPLMQALQDITAPLGVSIRLLDQIDAQQPISIRHHGTVGEAIEQIALLTGLSFVADERLVTWRQYEMAEFDVAFLAGATNFFLGADGQERGAAASIGGGSQVAFNSGLSDESPQYLNFASESLSVWDDLESALALLLSEHGEIAVNQSSTSVLIRDLPQHVAQVREYLVQQNERLTRQVAIDVQVIEVTFNDSKQAGIDWDLIYQMTRGSGVVNLLSGSNSAVSASGAALGYQRQSGPMAGASALISALNQQGVVEVSNHPRLVTLNNQISKIILEDNVTYLASSGTSSTANVGTSDLLIPGVVRTGFELYVLPKVANGQVLLQLSTSLSDLRSIDEVRSGEMIIQTPQTSRKKFFMKAIVADQETLLISGLENSRQQWEQNSSFGSWLLGGKRQNHRQHSETLLLLTPRILNAGAML